MDNNDCIFCKIVNGEIPASNVYEDEQTLAFLDIRPINIGHILVVPKVHYKNIYETPEEVMVAMMRTVHKLSKATKEGLNADGINVKMNNDPAAGQDVFHAHIHIIPRTKDDGLAPWIAKRPYEDGEKDLVIKKITEAL